MIDTINLQVGLRRRQCRFKGINFIPYTCSHISFINQIATYVLQGGITNYDSSRTLTINDYFLQIFLGAFLGVLT